MTQTLKLFSIGMKQISRDGILFALLPAPVLTGLLFKLGLPFAGGITEARFSFSLVPWYGLADGVLICLTPMLTGMISAFLLLEERDEGIGAFYEITPAAGHPYMAARLEIPMLWALIMTVAVTFIFGLSGLPAGKIILCAVISTVNGAALSMLVTKLAANRVEGLALSKMMGISLLGLPAVWTVPAPYYYLTAFLPSFWIGMIVR